MLGVAALQLGDDAQSLRVMVEPAVALHGGVEHVLAGMAETGVAKIMRQRQRLGEIVVKAQRTRQGAGDLADFNRMRQAGAVMVALVGHEHLAFVGQPAKRGGMDDAIAVALKLAARRRNGLCKQPSPALSGVCGIWGADDLEM